MSEVSKEVTFRSFTVELQTYIEQDGSTELHTVTVRNVVEYCFKCEMCAEGFKLFDDLKGHWDSRICDTCDDDPTTPSIREDTPEIGLDEVQPAASSNKDNVEMSVDSGEIPEATPPADAEQAVGKSPSQGETTEIAINEGAGSGDSTAMDKKESESGFRLPLEINCAECGDIITWNGNFAEHMRAHQTESSSRQKEKSSSHKCPVCEKTFVRRSSMKLHLRSHSGEKPYKCLICDKGFTTNSDLSRHVTRHSSTKPYPCPKCDKSFADKSYLRLHVKRHEKDNPNTCKICGHGFTTKSQLKMHVRKHTGEKPHKCTVCEKGFSNAGALKYHMGVHGTPKTAAFSCDVCEKTFCSKQALTGHIRTHTGEKPYSCPVCKKSFAQNVVKLHMRYHRGEKNFSCDQCEKSFTTKTHLETHQRSHTGEKPFECEFCGKSFGYKSSLIYHTRTHRGDKPFSCPLCKRCFTDNSTMKRHAFLCAVKNLGKQKDTTAHTEGVPS